MKKNEQLAINRTVESYIERINAELSCYDLELIGRLRVCNAHVYKVGNTYLLKSYNSWVAAVFQDTQTSALVFIDFLRWGYGYTNTSAQHIRKFKQDYFNDFGTTYTWRVIK